jgi:hypothetical protein
MSMASLESLERTLTRLRRHDLEVLEHEPAKGLVAAQDILRTDQYGRQMIAVPAGQEPPSYLTLTEQEKAALVPADEAPKPKTLTGPYGFNPHDAASGRIKVRVTSERRSK